MQGLFVNGLRPKSKKAVKEAVAEGAPIHIEATSVLGNEYDGPLEDLPVFSSIRFVGPDPYTKRNFYGTLTRVSETEVKVK